MLSDKIRLLAVCYEDPELLLGGMGTHVRELYQTMAKRDDVVIDLLTLGADQHPKIYKGFWKHTSDKLICYKPKRADITSYLTSDIQVLRRVLQMVAHGSVWDVVHIHEWNTVQVGRAVRDAFTIPMVGTMHLSITHLMEDDFPTGEDYVYIMQQEGHLVVDSDRIITLSNAYAGILRRIFMTDRPIDVIPNGVDRSSWIPDRGENKTWEMVSNKRPNALFVGRIAEMKGIRYILEAVEKEDNGFCVVLVGEVNADSEKQKEDWEITKRIRRLCREYPERLKWLGFRSGETLRDLYGTATVGLMPSIHEPFGIVALEFMASGVPLISTEVEGLGEIVNHNGEESALIIRPQSADDINRALKFLYKYKDVRSELIRAGDKRVRDFRWDDVAEQTVRIYREAINDSFNRLYRGEESNEAQSPVG